MIYVSEQTEEWFLIPDAREIKNRVWRFLLSAKDGDRMAISQGEYDVLMGRHRRFVVGRDPMKAMG